MLGLVQRTIKTLVTSAVNPKATLNRNLRLPLYISPDPDLDLYLDPNTESNTDNEPDINKYPDLKLGLKDLGLDFKAKEILKDIAKLRDKGLAKLNYTSYTKKL